jgi:uncharacterized protein YukJ
VGWLKEIGATARRRGWTRRNAEPYGVLRGRPIATKAGRAEVGSSHFQILVSAGGESWRVAVNVRSKHRREVTGHDSIVLYRLADPFVHPILGRIDALDPGFTALDPSARSGALDFVRGGLLDRTQMRLLPPDGPGPADDLNDLLTGLIDRVIPDPLAELFAFGMAWGPNPKEKDPVFHFRPGRGVHNVHMNQGNPWGFHHCDNGPWCDGGLLFRFAEERWAALFLAFQSQSWSTDDRTGHPLGAIPLRKTAPWFAGRKDARA